MVKAHHQDWPRLQQCPDKHGTQEAWYIGCPSAGGLIFLYPWTFWTLCRPLLLVFSCAAIASSWSTSSFSHCLALFNVSPKAKEWSLKWGSRTVASQHLVSSTFTKRLAKLSNIAWRSLSIPRGSGRNAYPKIKKYINLKKDHICILTRQYRYDEKCIYRPDISINIYTEPIC